MSSDHSVDREIEDDEELIERGETGIRILLTLLFWVVLQVVEAIVAVVILFDLVFALSTRREPSDRVKEFAERVIRYGLQVAHYMTYNRENAPFPFDEFPGETDRR